MGSTGSQHTGGNNGLVYPRHPFTDARLTIVLRELSKPEYWHAIEQDLGQNTARVYDLSAKRVRVDANTISGYHARSEDGLLQFGKSENNPKLLQVKLMMASLGPLGLPIATAVVSGEQVDDGLYMPIIDRPARTLNRAGLLFVGDCRMTPLQKGRTTQNLTAEHAEFAEIQQDLS